MTDRWARCERDLELGDWQQMTSRQIDPFRRVYLRGDSVVKIEMPQSMLSKDLRRQTLQGEYQTYLDCAGIRGIPIVQAWNEHEDVHALFLQRMPGEPIDIKKLGWFSTLATTLRLFVLSLRLAGRGVSHNDFDPSNILRSENGSISLIDFDQATKSSRFVAIVRVFFGRPRQDALIMTSVFYLLKIKTELTMEKLLPAPIFNALRRVKRSLTQAKNSRQLPVLGESATAQQQKLLSAWRIAQRSDANAPGAGVAYYEIEDGEYVFPGERPWIDRWDVLRQTADFNNKRILELGCNMGLLSIWLLKHGNAAHSMAVDHDAEIIESARLVAEAMDVSVDFGVADFDAAEPWEEQLLASKADIVFALNILNWVENKDRLLDFLANFEVVVFEGHDTFEVEKERFASRGFNDVELVSVSERSRPLIVCKKTA